MRVWGQSDCVCFSEYNHIFREMSEGFKFAFRDLKSHLKKCINT